MDEEYFEWLLTKAGIDYGPYGYNSLCWILFDKKFLPILEMDENRWEDGVRYREAFADTTDDPERTLDELDDLGGCNMMELILSMAERMSFEMADSLFEAGVGKWFDELLCNLGLDIYTDYCINIQSDAYNEIDAILDRLIFRHYRPDGTGSMFPLNRTAGDQRKMELISQMNYYLADHYDIL